jgi:hypothetical protein
LIDSEFLAISRLDLKVARCQGELFHRIRTKK